MNPDLVWLPQKEAGAHALCSSEHAGREASELRVSPKAGLCPELVPRGSEARWRAQGKDRDPSL